MWVSCSSLRMIQRYLRSLHRKVGGDSCKLLHGFRAQGSGLEAFRKLFGEALGSSRNIQRLLGV